jgi:hypothetical protein
MIAAALVALSLIGDQPFLAHGQTITRHHHVGGWTVRVIWDRFTGKIDCTVRKGHVELQNDVLIFHEDQWAADTTDAVFRIDAGSPRNVHDVTYEDQRRGYYRNGGPLENPSAGEVALPTYYVVGASWVYIRANVKRAPDAFDVRNFADALAAARHWKCPGLGP